MTALTPEQWRAFALRELPRIHARGVDLYYANPGIVQWAQQRLHKEALPMTRLTTYLVNAAGAARRART